MKSIGERSSGDPPEREPRVSRLLVLVTTASLISFVAAAVLLWDSSGSGEEQAGAGLPATDPGPVHVHGLGINPADGALFIATHTGLFRVGRDEQKATRVADRFQDTMGFTIAGSDRFLGSGHPDIREAQARGWPPLLGLIESNDAGESWEPVSLLGKTDFHVLRSAGRSVYGYDSSNERFLVSGDEGRTWSERVSPGRILDLVATPAEPQRLLAAAGGANGAGLFESEDGGRTWRRTSAAVGLLALPAMGELILVSAGGRVFASSDGGRKLEARGSIGGEPAALHARSAEELYVALHDGTVKQSTNGGRTWSIRSTP